MEHVNGVRPTGPEWPSGMSLKAIETRVQTVQKELKEARVQADNTPQFRPKPNDRES